MNLELLNENRAQGWIAIAASVPEWVKKHIIEMRSAVLEKRAVSEQYLQKFASECEHRSHVAARHQIALRHLAAHTPHPAAARGQLSAAQVRALAKKTGKSFDDILYGESPRIETIADLRMKAARYADIIAKDDLSASQQALPASMTLISANEHQELLRGLAARSFAARNDDDEDVDWDYDDEDAEEKHRRAAEGHRNIGRRAKSLAQAEGHYKAASLHDAAATNRSAGKTRAAIAASAALRKRK